MPNHSMVEHEPAFDGHESVYSPTVPSDRKVVARASWFCWWVGCLLLGSGLSYAVVWLVTGQSLEGPISLRKPLLFGASTGVTLMSISWVMSRVRERRWDAVLYTSLGAALFLEVALIDVQQFRGVPSHFNRSTPVDASIATIMEGLILWATVLILDLTVRCWRPMRLAADDARAARLGMLLLSLGCGLGVLIACVGEARWAQGLPPQGYGPRGVLKFPHGIPLHGIQLLQLQVWTLRAVGVPMRRRMVSLGAASAGIFAATAYGILQTWLGGPRLPPVGSAWVPALLTVLAGALALSMAMPFTNSGAMRRSTVDASNE